MQCDGTRSVYEQALGRRFGQIDPGLQRYFRLPPAGMVGVGRGVYDIAGSRWWMLRPVLAGMARRDILFPELGRDVPFTVVNTPHSDGTLTARRSFVFPARVRVMRDTMSVADGLIVDRIGRRGELEVGLDLDVVNGQVRLRSRRLALRLGRVRVPLPPVATVTVVETVEGAGQRVDVRIRMPPLGEIFRYTGSFTYAFVPRTDNERP